MHEQDDWILLYVGYMILNAQHVSKYFIIVLNYLNDISL